MARRRGPSDDREPEELPARVRVSHVAHPRYGDRPRLTGLDVDDLDAGVHLHWANHFEGTFEIDGTAVAADLAKQTPATFPVTHYLDLSVLCRDCARRFYFFAIEQKHWYEELGFPLDAVAVRCPPCRAERRELAALRDRYAELTHLTDPTPEQSIELATLFVALVEAEEFTRKRLDRPRAALNRAERALGTTEEISALRARITKLEGDGSSENRRSTPS